MNQLLLYFFVSEIITAAVFTTAAVVLFLYYYYYEKGLTEEYLKNPNKDITHIMGKKLDFERLSEGFDFEKYINLILK